MRRRTSSTALWILVLGFLAPVAPTRAECNDCPDILEMMALHCPKCFGGHGGNYGDPADDDVPPNPEIGNIVTCVAFLQGPNQLPVQGVQVNLKAHGAWADDDTCHLSTRGPGKTCATEYTDADGYAYLSVWADAEWEMDNVYCEAYVPGQEEPVRDSKDGQGSRLPNLVNLQLGEPNNPDDIDHIPFDAEIFLEGLEPSTLGHGTRYLSGNYDKVLILAQPFDSQENGNPSDPVDDLRPVDWRELWRLYSDVMLLAYANQWDVWLFEPNHTGDNLYEQASELAQLIQYAHDQQPPNDANGTERQILVGGASLGGLVARTALARWSDTSGNSQAWKAALGLDPTPPVGTLVTLDAPLQGANLPIDLQERIHKMGGMAHKTNTDSCASMQMLKQWCDEDSCDSNGYRSFYVGDGSIPGECGSSHPLMYPRDDSGGLRGANGLADAGYPWGVRVFAASNGRLGVANACYGDDRDDNRDGRRVCGPVRSSYNLLETMIDIDVRFPCNFFVDNILFHAWDRVPGSRHGIQTQDIVIQGTTGVFAPEDPGYCDPGVTQYGMGVFVPTTSALDIRACSDPLAECQFADAEWLEQQGFGSKHRRIDVACENDHAGIHSRAYPECSQAAAQELVAAFAGESYCSEANPGGCFPDPHPGTDGSCHLRCGGGSGSSCYCDAQCENLGDCCPDFDNYCDFHTCGDGTCDSDESFNYCPADCPAPACPPKGPCYTDNPPN